MNSERQDNAESDDNIRTPQITTPDEINSPASAITERKVSDPEFGFALLLTAIALFVPAMCIAATGKLSLYSEYTGLALGSVLILLPFLPATIALVRGATRIKTVLLLNVFLGWTIGCWIQALVIAVKSPRGEVGSGLMSNLSFGFWIVLATTLVSGATSNFQPSVSGYCMGALFLILPLHWISVNAQLHEFLLQSGLKKSVSGRHAFLGSFFVVHAIPVMGATQVALLSLSAFYPGFFNPFDGATPSNSWMSTAAGGNLDSLQKAGAGAFIAVAWGALTFFFVNYLMSRVSRYCGSVGGGFVPTLYRASPALLLTGTSIQAVQMAITSSIERAAPALSVDYGLSLAWCYLFVICSLKHSPLFQATRPASITEDRVAPDGALAPSAG